MQRWPILAHLHARNPQTLNPCRVVGNLRLHPLPRATFSRAIIEGVVRNNASVESPSVILVHYDPKQVLRELASMMRGWCEKELQVRHWRISLLLVAL